MLVTPTHACADQVKGMIANVRKGLDFVIASAPQLTKLERWTGLVQTIIAQILPRGPQERAFLTPLAPPAFFGAGG